MNRIFLVGNGFDQAHKLPTRYEDFINWYWAKWNQRLLYGKTRIEEDEFYSFKLKDDIQLAGWYLIWEWYFHTNPLSKNKYNYVEIAQKGNSFCTINSKSELFKDICNSYRGKNWVDIESEYYNHIFSPKYSVSSSIRKLNDQFETVRIKLIEYLSTIQEAISKDSTIQKMNEIFYEPIRKRDIAVSSLNHWYEFVKQRNQYTMEEWVNYISELKNKKYDSYLIQYDVQSVNEKYTKYIQNLDFQSFDNEQIPDYYILPNRTLLLNFNYTTMADMYLPESCRYLVNHIHGQLSDPDSIIFGYGDEIDKHYSELTEFNDNEYLRHIKSFKYLESSNYKNLLSFIDSEPYQICIMGHSCGISDRTLLKTLFEHPNCVSIKPYYYKQSSGQDNYLDIVQNISRNFSDMRLMRDRVVNKTLCTYLPQKEAEQQHIDE